jgi:hypothetical protein
MYFSHILTNPACFTGTYVKVSSLRVGFIIVTTQSQVNNDNDKPIKSLLKGKGLLPPVGLARLVS